MKRLQTLCGMLFLSVASLVRAETPDDQFFHIYNLIQQADALVAGGQSKAARPKYLEAQEGLVSLQKAHPDWNQKVIQFRLKYVAEKLGPLTASEKPALPAAAENQATRPFDDPGDVAGQIKLLREQVRQLTADKELLQAKLKEAWSAQPAAVDPRELASADEKNKSLQKEIDLLKVRLGKAEAKPDKPVDPVVFEDTKRALAGANQKLAQQTEAISALTLEREALQHHLKSYVDDSRVKALREGNEALKQQVSDLTPKVAAGNKATQLQQQLSVLQADLATQTSRNEVLLNEKKVLEDRLKALEIRRDTDLTAKTHALERELAGARTTITTNAVVLSALRDALRITRAQKETLQQEKARLESQLDETRKTLTSSRPTSGEVVRAGTLDAERVKQLERERDELQNRFNAVTKELYDHKARGPTANAEQLTNQIAMLRARLEALEAHPVPYSAEELALLKAPAFVPRRPGPDSGEKTTRELAEGAAPLLAEAGRSFSAGRFDDAEKKYQQVLRMGHRNATVLANLAAVQIEQNRLAEAEKNLKRALENDSRDAFSLSLLGILKTRQRKFDEALDALSRAAQLDPDNANTFQSLGVTLAEKGLRGPAESAFRRAIQLAPGNADAHHNLAAVYATQQPPAVELARWHYQKAIEAGHPKNSALEKILNESKAPAASK